MIVGLRQGPWHIAVPKCIITVAPICRNLLLNSFLLRFNKAASKFNLLVLSNMSAYRTEFHSSLEVVPPDTPQVFLPQAVSDPSQAPQVVPLPDKFATVSDTPIYTNDYKHDGSIPPPVDAEAASNKAKNNGKIMGMRRTTFWLVSFLVVLVLGGAIGGGVGATVGKKMNTEARYVSIHSRLKEIVDRTLINNYIAHHQNRKQLHLELMLPLHHQQIQLYQVYQLQPHTPLRHRRLSHQQVSLLNLLALQMHKQLSLAAQV